MFPELHKDDVYKQQELKEFIRRNNVNVLAIIEHRAQAGHIINKVAPSWEWLSNATTRTKGRIWLISDPR
ncbi:hypothetical protein RND71_038400 [Anisodus tanguticus]|uniref:Uncharacterized protein n=1 Tax=Anisodus tanguticus TaxID=243964 RepID=A0AAE1QYZ4_9SOLA|nr:hypothetical protein RND71_038400 [Anisodus tanguticus]